MGSSDESASPALRLGALLTAAEAREIADHFCDGDTLTAALRVVARAGGRRRVPCFPECWAPITALTAAVMIAAQ